MNNIKYIVSFKYINDDDSFYEKEFNSNELNLAKELFNSNDIISQDRNEEIEIILNKYIIDITDEDNYDIENLQYRTYHINQNIDEFIMDFKIALEKKINVNVNDYFEIPVFEDNEENNEQIISVRIKDHSWNIRNIENYQEYNFYLSIVITNKDFTKNKFNQIFEFEGKYNMLQINFNLENSIDIIVNETYNLIKNINKIMQKHKNYNSETFLYRKNKFYEMYNKLNNIK